MPFTQENRFLRIKTPLGEDVLLLTRFSGAEGVSIPFSLELDLISQNHGIVFRDIVGQNVTVSVLMDNGKTRFFNGIISRFSQAESSSTEGGEVRISNYSATVVPWFWLLTRTADSRIFQELSVPDIVEKIFQEKNFSDYKINLHSSYDKWAYCVQYRETDFNFISRLLEEEGIYYYFEHEDGKHTMVLADVPEEHKPCPEQESAAYHPSASGTSEEYSISNLEVMQEIRAGKYSLNDFNFETPATDLKVEVPSQHSAGPGEREMYDYPGGYGKRTAGDRLANIRMQEEEAAVIFISGSSNCRAFTSGYRFTLREYHRNEMNDKDYVLLSLSHMASEPYTTSEESGMSYMNSFTCIPFDVPFRPRRTTRKPVVEGVQTAIVVGPKGEEIYTDEHGRVKVQFHWDREGRKDENSSCWMRVSQLWAGGGWGAICIPRIGHEVIVSFEEGDPDRPIITGRVYHAINKPPYPLPDEKTKSTVKTDSSPDGGGFNEIRFEDKKGEEQLFLHAEKNMDTNVNNDVLELIGNDRHLIVKNEQCELVEKDKHTSVKGNFNKKVDGTISIKTDTDMQEKAGMNYALDTGMEIHLKAGTNVIIEGGMNISLSAGGSFLTIGPAGISMSGAMININSGGSAQSGSGSSPEEPKLPKTADSAKPGQKSPSPQSQAQAATLRSAARSGMPFCDT
ncbi:MAG: type VI secretion system tip protein VgrG [Nitrospirota bacterium]